MNSRALVDNLLVSSIDIINKTNISRATLNNYIKMNLIPNPIVKKPASVSTQARRLGYFPESVITTIEQIKKMKKDGYTMQSIVLELIKVGSDLSMDNTNNENLRRYTREKAENTTPQKAPGNDGRFSYSDQTILNQHQPTPVTFSIMVAKLNNSDQICDELLPDEYFELLNQVWSLAGESFIKYHGNSSRRIGNGMSYYFYKDRDHEYILDTIRCAVEIRSRMTNINREWGLRKKWLHEVCLNIGINEGQEYSMVIYSSTSDQQTWILGETVEHAEGLSEFASHGTIWTTKSLISKLTSVERKKLRYGIRRKNQESEIIMESLFNRMTDLMDRGNAATGRLQSLARLPITEILDLC